MEAIKRNVKSALIACFVAFITFLSLLMPNVNVSADEINNSPILGNNYNGIVCNDGTLPVVQLPLTVEPNENTKTLVQNGDVVGGWYSINNEEATSSLFNFKAFFIDEEMAYTIRYINNTERLTLANGLYVESYVKDGNRYFYLPATYSYTYLAPEDFTGIDADGDGVFEDFNAYGPNVIWYEQTTITYLYDIEIYHYDSQEIVVEPEEPGDVEEPGDEPSVEPDEPGIEPEEPGDEKFDDKFNAWLEEQVKNWNELSEAAQGLSVGAIVMLIGIVLLIAKRK